MAVKASRYLTHVRRLRDPAEPVARLLGAAAGLAPKLGPISLELLLTRTRSLPSSMGCLAEFRAGWPAVRGDGPEVLRIAVEPRHESWWTDEVRQILAEHDAALCWADRLGRPVTPLWRTAGGGGSCASTRARRTRGPATAEDALRAWVGRIREAHLTRADVYVYFNNDPGGAAVVNSAEFAAMGRQEGLTVTRTPQVGEVPLTAPLPTW